MNFITLKLFCLNVLCISFPKSLKHLPFNSDKIINPSNLYSFFINLTTDVNNGAINLNVVNKVGTKLPVTGSVGTLLAISLGTGLMSYSVARKKKNK